MRPPAPWTAQFELCHSGYCSGAVRAFPNLSFTHPVELLQVPGDSSRWFVIEQAGTVRVFDNVETTGTANNFISLDARVGSGGETGLLGSQLVSRLSEFRTTGGGLTLDPASELILLTVNQPEAYHNGGHLLFGTIGNGQDVNTLLGKLLRIDVDHAAPYAVPPTGNPYAGGAPCPEIYASGLRNPWKFSFDRTGGALWIADVGQDSWEEVDRISATANLGWRCREGAHNFNLSCGSGTGLTELIAAYAHPFGGVNYRRLCLPWR